MRCRFWSAVDYLGHLFTRQNRGVGRICDRYDKECHQ